MFAKTVSANRAFFPGTKVSEISMKLQYLLFLLIYMYNYFAPRSTRESCQGKTSVILITGIRQHEICIIYRDVDNILMVEGIE